MDRLVVIGNGMAGVFAVEEVLKIRKDLCITIFGEEPHFGYNRILLSGVLAGERPLGDLYLHPKEWYEQNRIDLRLGVRVTAIDPSRKTVTDSCGVITPYDRLLIAVGGEPFIPPIQGTGKDGVFVFRNIEDTEKILRQAHLAKQAVVIGGGLLGLEAARGLINYGVSVTVVHLIDRLMEQQLDASGAAILKREIERMGIGVILNTTAKEILGDGKAEAVRLTTGQELPAGMVMICTGIRPDLELARAAGLETHRGIVVNDRLETSVLDIYAVGDVIEHRGTTYGLVAPLRDQAKVVADRLVGQKNLCYEGTVCSTTLKVAGLKLTSAGVFLSSTSSAPGGGSGGGNGHEEIVYVDTQAAIYKKLVLRGNRLVGMILLGDNKDGTRLRSLIQSGQDISSVKVQLTHMISGQLSTEAAPGANTAATMADTELICNCNTVTKGTILTAIREKGLKTRDEVASCTKASTGCGSCAQWVEDLLREVNVMKTATSVQTPSSSALGGSGRSVEPLLLDKPVLGYPMAYPKSLEVERIKQEGLGLDFDKIRERGIMALTQDDYYRLKTYGVCSQKHSGYFMLRIRIPGGRVTTSQLVTLADLADTHGRGCGHLTTRQDLELHWVRVEEVPEIWEKLEAIGLSTRSACGHTMRNVVACPHSGICQNSPIDVQPWAKAVSDHFLKRSDLINPSMPNRLNIYIAGCAECTPHAQINDIGLVAVKRSSSASGGLRKVDGTTSEIGFELWVGGSLGAHPILGFKLKEFIPLQDALPACQAIFHIHMKYGSRTKAKSRLKWLVEQWGQEEFTRVFDKIFQGKRTLPENGEFAQPSTQKGEQRPSSLNRLLTAIKLPAISSSLPSGSHLQKQAGYVWMEVEVPLGEIKASQLLVLARISRRYGNGEVHFTQDQNVELHWIQTHAAHKVARALEGAGLALKGKKAGLRVIACPGTEFCVLAVTNAQGAARDILKQFTPKDPAKAKLLKEVSIHISGCPNSCAKHQVADIGLAGTMTIAGEETRFSYLLYLGGGMSAGVRLGEMVRKGITEEMVIPTLNALLDLVLEHRQSSSLGGSGGEESFRQVINRLGTARVAEFLEVRLTPVLPQVADRLSMVPDQVEVSP